MTAEENLARLVRERFDASEIIDLHSLARTVASLEFSDIPSSIDGVLFQDRGLHQPNIVINQGISTQRQVFTLAHELGHLFIPWHNNPLYTDNTGSLNVNSGDTGSISAENVDQRYRQTESEANRFAAELLMPRMWVADLMERHYQIPIVLDVMREVGVSTLAASYKLIDALEQPVVFIETNRYGIVLSTRQSSSVRCQRPVIGSRVDDTLYPGGNCHIEEGSNTRMYWWLIPIEVNKFTMPLRYLSDKSSKQVLEEILIDLAASHPQLNILGIRQSINGVIGGTNNSYLKARETGQEFDFLNRLRLNFESKDNLQVFLSHPFYEEYLALKFNELSQ